MSKNLYIAGVEADSGKSLIVLGIMTLLSRHIKKIGFFRPIIRVTDDKDHDIELVSKRTNLPFKYDEMYGLTNHEAQEYLQENNMDELLTIILNKYKNLEAKCDFVLCEGTDFAGSLQTFEFDFNTQLANNLGAPVLAVINGQGKSVNEIADITQMVRSVMNREKCSFQGMFVNRAREKDVDPIWEILIKYQSEEELNFVIPELEELQKLTIRQIGNALNAQKIYGNDAVFDFDVSGFKVAAMGVEHILENTESGSVVITPGDRSDVLVSLFMTLLSDNYPKIAGIILSGGYKPSKELMSLINGIQELSVAILKVNTDTFTTVMNVNKVKPRLTPDNERRIAAALGHFESNIDGKKLIDKIAISPTGVVTPIMFEYQLYERARSNRKHIVLPEGLDDRILQGQ